MESTFESVDLRNVVMSREDIASRLAPGAFAVAWAKCHLTHTECLAQEAQANKMETFRDCIDKTLFTAGPSLDPSRTAKETVRHCRTTVTVDTRPMTDGEAQARNHNSRGKC